MSYCGFSDESSHNVGRFRGVAIVTMRASVAQKYTDELQELLGSSDVREFKWVRLQSARERFAALKMLQFTVREASSGGLRVDVLTWDTEDGRHRVRRRDDGANLGRMYFHLLRKTLPRWPAGSWAVWPDEHSGMDWLSLRGYLDGKGTRTLVESSLFSRLVLRLERYYQLRSIQPCRSSETPLVQLADLFVGLGVFSRTRAREFGAWRHNNPEAPRLFDDAVPLEVSRADRERFQVMQELEKACKASRLGVSLKTHGAFRIPNPSRPINFWWYEPQHQRDKAPVKL